MSSIWNFPGTRLVRGPTEKTPSRRSPFPGGVRMREDGKAEMKKPIEKNPAGTRLMSNLDLYFNEVKAYPLLTRDEECELARGIHRNDG